jgi:crotonobetainyl-CoA:carnitine CoA-transferase CaiB-like acyl-CoA transferase
VPCARVAEKIDELIDDPSLRARGMLHPLQHPLLGVLPGIFAPSVPIHTPGEATPPLARAPLLGEHTHAILARELGLSADEIRDLEAKNVI